jgi:hypothetical protein
MSRYKYLLILCSFCFFSAAQAHAADLRECEKAKLRQLKLERAAHNKSSGSKKKSGASKSRQSAEQLDEWLWKNCRNYSYELRTLEQQQM